ncbi:hypothetical protein B0A55_04744 [Friedmanniomyces simplex]|uniref:Uncharacterized protein n=1 Tax=Friedmanniomyces simplex TaxID=329884 RepID=A0A4U0XS72_9PEZI|nr:hypothetical protein B0A55_04744 [Friedmanniomyces simplex]
MSPQTEYLVIDKALALTTNSSAATIVECGIRTTYDNFCKDSNHELTHFKIAKMMVRAMQTLATLAVKSAQGKDLASLPQHHSTQGGDTVPQYRLAVYADVANRGKIFVVLEEVYHGESLFDHKDKTSGTPNTAKPDSDVLTQLDYVTDDQISGMIKLAITSVERIVYGGLQQVLRDFETDRKPTGRTLKQMKGMLGSWQGITTASRDGVSLFTTLLVTGAGGWS